ncbi:hypothetical protein MJK72_18840 [Klebsiella pneumoniae]|nr:hypothetical protein MJK72_18840 [Klebsiella pneumoniae]
MRIVNDGGIQTDGQKLFARKASAAFTTFQRNFARTFRHPAIQEKWQA